MAHSTVRAQTTFPTSLVSYWNFDESSSGTGMALDLVDGNDGTFAGSATRTTGLIGVGSALFNNTNTDGVNLGSGTGNNFSVTTGVTVEALIQLGWSGASLDYDQIFRKSDGGGARILLAFQNDGSSGAANPPVAAGPALSFGLVVAGTYSELDMPLDGVAGRPTLAELTDGNTHHVVATYDSVSGLKAIYIDGTLRFSTNLGGGNLVTSGGGGAAFIGSRTATEPFTGTIDEVAFYNAALSTGAISSHYNNTVAGRGYFTAQTVPTLSEWGLIGLALLLILIAMIRLWRPSILK